MAHLRLILLGGFAAHVDGGDAIALPTRKAEALLALLAFQPGERRRRECIAALLWGGRGDRQARHGLSQALTSIRRALGAAAPALLADRETVALSREEATVDVVDFQRLAGSDAVDDLQAAADLYRGALLDGLKLREPAFEAWLTAERARLHELAISILLSLATRDAGLGDGRAAVAALNRALALDPLAEGAHRGLIRLDLDRGAYNAAIRQYRQCADVLRHELDTVPEPSTTALYREARRCLESAPPEAGAAGDRTSGQDPRFRRRAKAAGRRSRRGPAA